MLRGLRLPVIHSRNVYIPSSVTPSRSLKNSRRTSRSEAPSTTTNKSSATFESRREAALLDTQLRQLKAKQAELRQKINESKDRELQTKLAEKDGAKLTGSADAAEIAKLNAQLKEPVKAVKRAPMQKDIKLLIPSSIRSLLPASNETSKDPKKLVLFKPTSSRQSWSQILEQLSVLPELTPKQDVEKFVSLIPLHQRSLSLPILERIIPEGLRTPFVEDLFMAAYAEQRNPEKIEEMINKSAEPTVYSFGHWVKALFRTRSPPEKLLDAMKRMTRQSNLEPSLPVMSTVIQSLIQHSRHTEAETLFDNMKYWSVETQPDLKLYNSMILSAARQHNVNRALDLFNEMKTRRPYPLAPNAETYNYLVYACSRSAETQMQAWNFFIEAQAEGFEPDRRSFQALLYLCGNSGEVLLARALVRNLAAKSFTFVDDFVLNSLMASYRSWKPGPSPILSSPTGQNIRASIMMNDNFQKDPSLSAAAAASSLQGSSPQIPFLPLAQLDRKLMVLESAALVEFFVEHNPSVLRVNNVASLASNPVMFNFLRIAVELCEDNISEFKKRYNRFTHFDDIQVEVSAEEDIIENRILDDNRIIEEGNEDTEVIEKSSFTVPRDQHIYRLAIQAATKVKDLDFGREIWTERGLWRRKSAAFRALSPVQRNRLDFHFARDLVELLAVCGRIEEAIMLLKSAKNLKRWRKHHIAKLMEVCEEMEDHASLKLIAQLVSGA